MPMNTRSRNVVRPSTTYAPPNAVAPVTIVRAAMSPSPTRDTPSTRLRAPGLITSTRRTAIASATPAANGPIVTTSLQVIGSRPFRRHDARRRGGARSEAQEPDDDDRDDDPDADRHDRGVDHDGVSVRDGRQGVRDRLPEQVEQQAGEEPERDDQRRERRQRQDLDGADVREVVTDPEQEGRRLAEGDPLEHPEQVGRAEDHHERGHRGGPRVRLERADERQELADEARQPGQPGRGEDEEPEGGGIDRGQ